MVGSKRKYKGYGGMLTGYRWEYILHGRGVVVLAFMGVGQVLLFVYKK